MDDGASRPAATFRRRCPGQPAATASTPGTTGTGVRRVDYRAVAALALPLMLNSSLQAVISLTDTWFVGHISTAAMAGMAAVYWIVLLFLMLIGGVGLARADVRRAGRRQPPALAREPRGLGGRSGRRALTLPLYAALGFGGHLILRPFGLDAEIQRQAIAFWQPRMLGAPIAVALWAILGFFNGISPARRPS